MLLTAFPSSECKVLVVKTKSLLPHSLNCLCFHFPSIVRVSSSNQSILSFNFLPSTTLTCPVIRSMFFHFSFVISYCFIPLFILCCNIFLFFFYFMFFILYFFFV